MTETEKLLITENYRQLNRILHIEKTTYGTGGHKWASKAVDIAIIHDLADVLDYGCGKGTFSAAFENFWIERCKSKKQPKMWLYDPALPIVAQPPPPCDLVVCTDVLEHVEPEYVENVLADLRRVTKRAALIVISTRPAKKHLPDGRNAHLTIQNADWWVQKLRIHFGKDLNYIFDNEKDELVVEAVCGRPSALGRFFARFMK